MIIDNSDVLRTFSGLVFEQKINELSKVNDEFEKLTRQEIYLKIAHLPWKQTLSDENLRQIAVQFGVTPRAGWLD